MYCSFGTQMYVFAYMHVCVYIICTNTYILHTDTCIYTNIYYTCEYIYTCMGIYIYVCVYIECVDSPLS